MDKIFQIFVSSTFEDLKLERQEVMAAVVSTGNVPVGMEYFPAGNASPFDYIKQQIDNVDYYILILAGKYGSINKDTGISYTEMEFDYAVEKKVPIAVLQYKDIKKLPGDKLEIEDAHKRKLLEAFRKKSKEGRMADFWETPTELKMKVKDAIRNLIENSPRSGWVKADQVSAIEQSIKTSEERKKKEATIKLIRKEKILENVFIRYLVSIFNVTTPLDVRNDKRPKDIITYNFDFSFNDMSDLYKTSLMLTDSSFKPAIAIYFENQDKLYSELMSIADGVELSYYPDLEAYIQQFLKNCNDFSYKGSILQFATSTNNNHNAEMMSKMIKEHNGELVMRPSNALNLYIALYYLLHSNCDLAQSIIVKMKSLNADL